MEYKYATRIYQNPKYGKYIGPNRTNLFVFNATIDVVGYGKWISDLCMIKDLQVASEALTTDDVQAITEHTQNVLKLTELQLHNTFFGETKFYNQSDGSKTRETGFLAINLEKSTGFVWVKSKIRGCELADTGFVRGCSTFTIGKKSPNLLMCNYSLSNNHI